MTFDKRKYDQQFQKDNYDRIALNVKKGDKAIQVREEEKDPTPTFLLVKIRLIKIRGHAQRSAPRSPY